MKPKYITPYADEWFSGPPPSVGWWPADFPELLRYYDGENWSAGAMSGCSAEEAGFTAAYLTTAYQPNIKWAKRWWEKAE